MFHFDRDFVDKNGERHMLPKRISKLAQALWTDHSVTGCRELYGFEFREGKASFEDREKGQWQPFDSSSGYWGKKDCYCWFRQSFEIPGEFGGKTVWYEIIPGNEGEWAWANPQICIYVNGRIVQGMDSNHRHIVLSDCAKAGDKYEVHIDAYTDTFFYKGPVRMRSKLLAVDNDVIDLYYDIAVPLEAAREMDSDNIHRVDIIKHLNEAVNLVNINNFEDRKDFKASVLEARKYLEENLYNRPCDPNATPVVSCVGHTHIDVAWLWCYEQTRQKALRSFATALKLIERNDDFYFMSSQAQLYDFVKEGNPELFKEIQKRVSEGRWEAEGGMWVESDTNLVSGESLIRQILFGKRYFKENFNVDNKVLWLPDVFGYSAALPQILRKCGMDYFMTTKISWNEYNKLPYDTFNWRGIDGSEVLAHFIPTGAYAEKETDWLTTYNGVLNPSFVMGAWKRYQQKELNREVLFAFGHGDGGGGANQEMIEYNRRLEKGVPGCPRTKFNKVAPFFEKLKQDVGGHKYLPAWDGELYFEYHRGVYTSMAKNKRYNRKSEILFHDLENLAAITGILCDGNLDAYPAEEINGNMKLMLLNQFHDVLPGSSIQEVYEDSWKHYEKIMSEGAALKNRLIDRLAEAVHVKGNGVLVVNTLSFARDELAVMDHPGFSAFKLTDTEGTSIPWQKTPGGKVLFLARQVPAKGAKLFRIKEREEAPIRHKPLIKSKNHMENDFYLITFDQNMNIDRFYCKNSGRDLFKAGELSNRFIVFEDRPPVDDAWNINAYYQEKFAYIDDVQKAEIVEDSEVRATLRVVRKYKDSTLTTDISIYHEIERVDFNCSIDWHECNVLLKLDFPVEANANKAHFDIQFGNIERSITRNTLSDFARFEVCAHKWVNLSDNGNGLTLINDCKYGYDVSKGHIRLSVLKCSLYPNPQQDKYLHEFAYSLVPENMRFDAAAANRKAYSFNYPLHTRLVRKNEGTLPESFSFAAVDQENILLETIKKAEDGGELVLRLFEGANRGGRCTLSLYQKPVSVYEADMLENKICEIGFGGPDIQLDFKPFEIKTIMVRF